MAGWRESACAPSGLTGRRTGRAIELPVQYARVAGGVVVLAGRSFRKKWWRNFHDPRAVDVWLDGAWRSGVGRLVEANDPVRASDLAAYRAAFGHVPADTTDPLVRVTLTETPLVPPPSGWRLWRMWVAWVTAGETVGFLVPALVGALTAGYPAATYLPSLLLAGAVEGAFLGVAQAHVLRRVLPSLSARAWVAATSAAAVIAWLIGMTPVVAAGVLGELPRPVVVVAAILLGSLLLLSIGTAQWTVLRNHVVGAGRWIAVTAVAWVLGLAAFMLIATPLWHEGQPFALTAAIGVLAGLVMAGTVAAVTGLGLVRLLRAGPTP